MNIVYIRLNYKDCDKLKERLILFEQFCLPSLLSQTSKNFKIYININKDFYDLVEKYSKITDNIFLTEENITTICNIKRTQKYLITTRLDSDDTLNIIFKTVALTRHLKTSKLNRSFWLMLRQSLKIQIRQNDQ